MTLSNLDLKRIYYYVICTIAFFVLMWGTIDLASSSVGLFNIRKADASLSVSSVDSPLMPEKGEQFFDVYYQKKMLYDRFWDSLARILISGLVFAYCRYTVGKMEETA
ncbi:MAG: hypothetical protein KKA31_01195 [Candidatus Margulisbacteria bacterium]|nr:hypothetical protein [Candidatus Margulisiibacteriota bacterium]